MKKLKKLVREYLEERGWNNLHPGDIAKSIVIESAELLEIFQWDATRNKTQIDDLQRENVKKELADILIYCLDMSVILDLDLEKIIEEKLEKVKKKYPVEKFSKANSGKVKTQELYTKIKQSYRRKGIN